MNNNLYKLMGILSLGLFLSLSSDALAWHPPAYLDPGTGSYIFQVLIAGLVGMGFAIKLSWGYIKACVISWFAKKKDNDQQP